MEFLTQVTEKGVTERGFRLRIGEETVPGILWTPERGVGPRPVVLIGHGGTQHKRVPNVLGLARRLVRHLGYAAVAIDAPDHGDRAPADAPRLGREERLRRIREMTPSDARRRIARFSQAVDEWRATLDVVRDLDEIGDGPVGYWGLSMGTAIGIPFLASEPRIEAAVLGLAGLGGRLTSQRFEEAARSLRIPVLFVFQWDDELMTREAGLALFDTLDTEEKTMHVNPGRHVEVPLFERDAYEAFFERHLGSDNKPSLEATEGDVIRA